MRARLRRWVPVLISLAVSPLHLWFVWTGYRELFWREEGVHFPRVELTELIYSTQVKFCLDTPTVTHFLIMAGGWLAFLSIAMLVYHTIRRSQRRRIIFWTVFEGAAFTLSFVSALVAIDDFFSNAGQFG